MTSENKMQALAKMTTRQKATAGVVLVVVLILIWQLSSMFGGQKAAPPKPVAAKPMPAAKPGAAGGAAMAPQTNPAQSTPKPADISMGQPLSDREAEIMKLQQETQAKYLQAVSELQMLKLARDIAVTNQDISKAKLARVQSEKKIVDILTPPAPPPVAESITKNIPPVGASGMNQGAAGASMGDQEVKYSVVSVSQLQYRWSAVMSFKGSLFTVRVGDVLPPDGSTVVSIATDGVVLSKDGEKKKVSLIQSI